jgi:NitT/TauT family transport system permease protein
MSKRLVAPVVGIIVFLGAWEAFVRLFHVRTFILEAPSRALGHLFDNSALFRHHAWITLQHASLGIACSLAVALVLGAILSSREFLERAAEPILTLMQVAPWFAYFSSVVLWLHSGSKPVVFLVAIACLPAFVFATVDGMRSADPAARELLASVAATRLDVLWRLRLPAALVSLFGALRFNIGLALAAAYYGETGNLENAGLGWLGSGYSAGFDGTGLWATVFMMVLVGSAALLLLSIARRSLLHWHASQRSLPG